MPEAHETILKGIDDNDVNTITVCLTDCQNAAVSVGTKIDETEGEGTTTVKALEEYCELLFLVRVTGTNVKAEGLIREWGVSNFDTDDMEELWSVPDGKNCLVNQVLYNTGSRGIEYSLLPWMLEHDVALMSYCPLAQAGSLKRGLMQNQTLEELAKKYEVSVPEILLALNIRNGHTIAMPRSSRPSIPCPMLMQTALSLRKRIFSSSIRHILHQITRYILICSNAIKKIRT